MAELEWEQDLDRAASLPVVGDLYRNYQTVINIILSIARFMSFPVYVFMHKDLGERTHSFVSIYVHLAVLGVITFDLMDFIQSTSGGGFNINLIVWSFIGMVIYHSLNSRKRRKQGDHIHSRSIGEPYGFWAKIPFGDRPSITMGMYEPIAIIVAAWLLSSLGLSSVGITSYMTVCAISLFINIRLMIALEHAAYLDDIDAQLDAEYKHELQKGNLPTTKEAREHRND